MMHYVFLVGSYYPNYSAVSKCVSNVAEILARNNRVTIICEKSSLEQKNIEVYNNQTILRFLTSDMAKRLKIIENNKRANGINKNIGVAKLIFLKLRRIYKLVFSKTSIDIALVSAYKDALRRIDENIDVLIPTSMPFESVIAAHEYCLIKGNSKYKTIYMPYLFDKFTDSLTLHRFSIIRLLKRKLHIQLEREVLSNADKIIAIHTLKDFYVKNLKHLSEIVYTEHPLLIPIEYNKFISSQQIKIAYIGGFYKKYVEPNYLLNLLSKCKIEAVCEFYTIGNCHGIINKFSKKFPTRIVNYGSVDKGTATQKIIENDILLSVAEKSGSQLSSKIFDYISSGKPIVHFYKNDLDVNFKILQNYPLAMCIKEDTNLFQQNLEKFEEFCINNHKKSVSWNVVVDLFSDALPIRTSQLISNIVSDIIR